MTSPIKLDVSLGAGLRSGCGCLTVVVLIMTALAGMAALDSGMSTFQTAVTLGLFVGLPLLVLVGVWIFLRRGTRAWIEGTTLVRTVAYRTSRIDLTQADVVYTGHSLLVREPVTGSIRLPLRSPLSDAAIERLKECART